jgi:hypothetical protein
MKTLAALFAILAVVVWSGSAATAQGKKPKRSAQPACLNALACGPQPVPKIRKPRNEKFMKSAS